MWGPIRISVDRLRPWFQSLEFRRGWGWTHREGWSVWHWVSKPPSKGVWLGGNVSQERGRDR